MQEGGGSLETAAIIAFVAIGANLPAPDGASPQQACLRAVRAVTALPAVSGGVLSRWFSSAPVPSSGQPRYVNGVLRISCTLEPAALLAVLQAIEAAAGRRRGAANAARPLDLDIIDIGGLCRTAPDPILPHPRAHLRGFVLRPLRDVAPAWVHPSTRQTLRQLLDALAPEDTLPLHLGAPQHGLPATEAVARQKD